MWELVGSGSATGVRRVLNRLEQQGLVLSEAAGQAILFQANREHLLWAAIEGLARIAETALVELQQRITGALADDLSQKIFEQLTVAVYGSVARGTSTVHSDIDLVVVAPNRADPETVQSALDRVSDRVQRWTGNQCNVYLVNGDRLAQMKAEQDPMIESWKQDAVTFHGPDTNKRT